MTAGAWPLRALGDVCEVIGGGTPSKSRADYYSGDIPWATVRDMRSDVITDTEFKITAAGVANSATNVIPRGNVVIATRVGLGKVCRLAHDTAINQDLRGVIPLDLTALSVPFLFWWLKSVSRSIVKEGRGVTIQGVNLPFIKGLRLPIPSIREQRRTVAILDEASEGIAAVEANSRRNLQNARAVFDSYFAGVFGKGGAGWAQKPFSELCDIKHGFAFTSEFFTDSGKYVLLTPGNFYETGGYRDRGEKQKYFAGEIPEGFILSKGDLLVAMTEQAAGLLGSPLLVPESARFLHNQRLGLVIKKAGVPWTNNFFFHVFNTDAVRKAIHDSASGVKVRHTSPTKIGNVMAAYPTALSEQKQIVDRLEHLKRETRELEAAYQSKLAALEALKWSLLDHAFGADLGARAA